MDLDKPISIRYKSQELEELEESFNIMRERLRRRLGELNEAANLLEARVAERTEQLKAAHQKLLHNDRLASLGQLAASVAHEINNPDLRRPESLHAAGADHEGGQSSARAGRGVPEVSGAHQPGDVARRPHRLRPAGVFAALQTAAPRPI